MADHMHCRVGALAGGHLVSVVGEIDLATAPRLAETLVQFANGSVTVDLTDVTFIDSSGLNALVAAHRLLERRHSRLIVRGMTARTERLFEISGVGAVLYVDSIANDHARED
jgi:anti-sigma B factor antagonist